MRRLENARNGGDRNYHVLSAGLIEVRGASGDFNMVSPRHVPNLLSFVRGQARLAQKSFLCAHLFFNITDVFCAKKRVGHRDAERFIEPVAYKTISTRLTISCNFTSQIKEYLGWNVAGTFQSHCEFLEPRHENPPSLLNRTTLGAAYSPARRRIISPLDHA